MAIYFDNSGSRKLKEPIKHEYDFGTKLIEWWKQWVETDEGKEILKNAVEKAVKELNEEDEETLKYKLSKAKDEIIRTYEEEREYDPRWAAGLRSSLKILEQYLGRETNNDPS